MWQELGERIRQDWSEYIWFIVIGAVIIRLLIKKSTREITVRIIRMILLGIVVIAFALAFIGVTVIYLFGAEKFCVIYPFTVMELPLLFFMIMSFKDLSETVSLHKNGCRTTGTVIDIAAGKGSHYKIRYYVNNKEYICIGNKLSQANKWECGSDVTVLYSSNSPQRSCLAKEDLVSSVIITAAMVLLLIGAIAAECVVMTAL